MPVEIKRGTVCLVEDDDLIRKGLKFLLDQQGMSAREFATGHEFLDKIESIACDCVLLDINLPDMNGLDILNMLGSRRPDIKVVIVTGSGDIPTAVRAMQMGAVDFIEKPPTADRLREAVDRALQAKLEAGKGRPMDAGTVRSPLDELSERERQVLALLVSGLQHKMIARELGISPRTVEVHRSRIMKRFGARSFAELVRISIFSGLSIENQR